MQLQSSIASSLDLDDFFSFFLGLFSLLMVLLSSLPIPSPRETAHITPIRGKKQIILAQNYAKENYNN
jgi:hypothetical protein